MTSTKTETDVKSNQKDLQQYHILCILILAISTLCFLVSIVYQLWSSQKFWEYPPSLSFALAGIIGYVLVFWLIFKSASTIGSEVIFNWPFIIFLGIFLNVVVFSIPGLGINVVATIIGELIVAAVAYLSYETWTKRKKTVK